MDLVFEPPVNATTFPNMLQYFNSLTDVGQGGALGIVILVVFGAVLFFMTKSFGTERAAGTSFFIAGLVAVLLKILNLINNQVLTIAVIFSILGIYLLIKESSNYDA